MYIEFILPQAPGGMAYQLYNNLLDRELQAWSNQFAVKYTVKNIKFTKRVTFDDDALYSFFSMTWNPKNDLLHIDMLNYRLIEPMHSRQA